MNQNDLICRSQQCFSSPENIDQIIKVVESAKNVIFYLISISRVEASPSLSKSGWNGPTYDVLLFGSLSQIPHPNLQGKHNKSWNFRACMPDAQQVAGCGDSVTNFCLISKVNTEWEQTNLPGARTSGGRWRGGQVSRV